MNTPILNHALVLESRTRTPDGAGGVFENWGPVGTLWAQVKPRTGREVRAEGGAIAATALTITVRGAPFGDPSRPLAGQRFRDGERIYTIEAVIEADVRGRFLDCVAVEEVAP